MEPKHEKSIVINLLLYVAENFDFYFNIAGKTEISLGNVHKTGEICSKSDLKQ